MSAPIKNANFLKTLQILQSIFKYVILQGGGKKGSWVAKSKKSEILATEIRC